MSTIEDQLNRVKALKHLIVDAQVNAAASSGVMEEFRNLKHKLIEEEAELLRIVVKYLHVMM